MSEWWWCRFFFAPPPSNVFAHYATAPERWAPWNVCPLPPPPPPILLPARHNYYMRWGWRSSISFKSEISDYVKKFQLYPFKQGEWPNRFFSNFYWEYCCIFSFLQQCIQTGQSIRAKVNFVVQQVGPYIFIWPLFLLKKGMWYCNKMILKSGSFIVLPDRNGNQTSCCVIPYIHLCLNSCLEFAFYCAILYCTYF